jgi:hypothetical protein
MKKARLVFALVAATLLLSLSVGSALAGEITGNGFYKGVKGNSECSFSGQEDLQWFFDNGQVNPKPEATRGDPSHAQSWGQAKVDWEFLISVGAHPGNACNPHKTGGLH